jgi:hypothetical protein
MSDESLPNPDHCDEKHRRWTDEVQTPKVKLLVGAMLGACLTLALAAMMYVSSNNVRDHELRDYNTFVSSEQHTRDLGKIEAKIEKMETNLNGALINLSDKLDRNYRASVRSQP